LDTQRRILLGNINEQGQNTINGYESRGGYAAMRNALELDPLKILE